MKKTYTKEDFFEIMNELNRDPRRNFTEPDMFKYDSTSKTILYPGKLNAEYDSKLEKYVNVDFKNFALYCGSCNENHNDIELTFTRAYDDGVLRFNPFSTSSVTCKKCNTTHKIEDICYMKSTDCVTKELLYSNVYKDDSLVKLSIATHGYTALSGKIQYKQIKRKITVNTKTGQLYIIKCKGLKNIKRHTFINKFPMKRNLMNVTYVAERGSLNWELCSIDNLSVSDVIEMQKEFCNKIYEGVCESLGYSPKTLGEYATECGLEHESDIYTLQNIALYNRFPNINTFILKKISGRDYHGFKKIDGLSKVKALSDNPLRDLCNIYKIPNIKSMKKYILEKPDKFRVLAMFSLFFQDPNILKNVAELICLKHEDEAFRFGSDLSTFEKYLKNKKRYKTFFKELLKNRSESIVFNKMKNCDMLQMIEDVINMYDEIKKHAPNFKLDGSGNLSQIHDKMIESYNNLNIEGEDMFKYINYTSQEKTLNRKIGKYSLELARHKAELNIIGRQMKICVGGYGSSALKKYIYISTLRDENGKYLACIELKNINKSLHIVQAKLYDNDPVSQDESINNTIVTWARELGLAIKTKDIDATVVDTEIIDLVIGEEDECTFIDMYDFDELIDENETMLEIVHNELEYLNSVDISDEFIDCEDNKEDIISEIA